MADDDSARTEVLNHRIGELATQITTARVALIELLADACPGAHRYVQHRDRRPAWCNACRRTGLGFLVPPSDAWPQR